MLLAAVNSLAERLLHLELLEFVPRKHHQPFEAGITGEDGLDEGFAEGTGAAGDQNRFIVEHVRVLSFKF
jgi:hypothetical protein